MKTIYILLFLSILYINSNAQRIIVPKDQPTIQAAINSSSDGDSVIVEPGRYFENINLLGKNIVLTSKYSISGDRNFISTTIIDGSRPSHQDTASCILIISGEDSSCVIQGFTICNGTGTKWLDEHGAGTYYEGGGILMTNSSPLIKNNIIRDNQAIRSSTGTSSAGGGGIRIGDGNPYILNNIIMSNKGMYGGGIVLNFTGGVIRNNIIYNNSVYEAVPGKPTFGGGGIWAYRTMGNTARIIENNTIIGNHVSGSGQYGAGRGGGILLSETTAQVRNNIIWGNSATTNAYSQISPNSHTLTYVTYNNIMKGRARLGEVYLNPQFSDFGFYLTQESPCIDTGNPELQYFDREDQQNTTMAFAPSLGSIRNDIGAYGGPACDSLPIIPIVEIAEISASINFGEIIFGYDSILPVIIENSETIYFNIDSIKITNNILNNLEIIDDVPGNITPFLNDSLFIKWTPSSVSEQLQDNINIYHDNSSIINPYTINLTGESSGSSSINSIENNKIKRSRIDLIYPNPMNNFATLNYTITKNGDVSIDLFNLLGQNIKSIFHQKQNIGSYNLEFALKNIPVGLYLMRLNNENSTDNIKLIIK